MRGTRRKGGEGRPPASWVISYAPGVDSFIGGRMTGAGLPCGGVMGGHLFKAIIFSTTEIVIGKMAGSSVYKAKSDVTGLWELQKK